MIDGFDNQKVKTFLVWSSCRKDFRDKGLYQDQVEFLAILGICITLVPLIVTILYVGLFTNYKVPLITRIQVKNHKVYQQAKVDDDGSWFVDETKQYVYGRAE